MNARFRVAGNAAVGVGQGASTSQASASAARGANSSAFHPTVVSLIILVLAEYAFYAWLRYYFRHAHGG